MKLPIHARRNSDRFIVVLSGRGFFRISPDSLASFTDESTRHVPVRERDVLMFPRGTVHTFSTDSGPMLLLSYHAPYIPLDDADQYTIPNQYAFPAETLDTSRSKIACDPAWTLLS